MGETESERRHSKERPRQTSWGESEVEEFGERIRSLLEILGYGPEDLDLALGYSPRGCLTRQILRGRQPSRPYAEKPGKLEADPAPPKPGWLPPAAKVLTGEARPAFMVETGRRECVECLSLQAEGEEVDQVHFFAGHPWQVVHTRCRKSWRRRRRWFRVCERPDCSYLTIWKGSGVPICESQDRWGLSRKGWNEADN